MRELYERTRFTAKGAEWPPQQAKIFVSVALVHYKGKRTQQEYIEITKIQKEGAPAIDIFASSTYKGPSAKKPRLDYSRVTKNITDIFVADPTDLAETGTSSTKAPKCILIEGAPGIGKTVLAKEIAYCWAKNEILTEIKFVFLLYLRDPQLRSVTTTSELIEYMCMGCLDDEQIKTFTKYIRNANGQQLCIVMDGFDEYPASLQKHSIIADIINGRVLPGTMIVITSRPTATVSLLHDQVDRRIDILGLPKEERDNYILQVFSNSPEKKEKLDKYLKQQPVINGLCFVPLHLAVLLYLFQQGSLPETLTEMNESFILHTIYRHLKRYELTPTGPVDKLAEFPKPVLDIVYKLTVLAFKGLQENKLVFTFDEIRKACPHIDVTVGAINGFGLLQAVEHYPHKGAGTTKSFNFLHFTMQEFLAAFHVSTLPSEHQSSLMMKTFWDDRYNFMWMMFVGIVGIKSDVFVQFVSKGKVYVRKSGIRVAESILSDKRKRLHVFQCYMEAKSSAEAPDVISSMFKHGWVIISGVKLLPHHLSSLMTFMSNSSMQWRRLELRGCKITDVGMNVLEQFMSERMSSLEYVDLCDNESSPWGVYYVIIRNCCIDRLTLCGDHGMKEYVNEVTKYLQNRSLPLLKLRNITKEGFKLIFEVKTLQKLDLSMTDLYDDGPRNISDCLKSNNSLQELDMSCNKITSEGAKKIGEAIEVNTTLHKLNINSNTISDDGAAAISEGLKCNISLQELYMEYNKITCEGAKKIGEAIEVNTTLHKLNINGNTISDDGAAAISEGLKCNISLQELYMEYNEITCEGAKKIGEAIEVNTTLHKLNINGNTISDDGAAAISEGLKCNNSLQELYMEYNKITCEGAKKIGEAIEVNTTLHKLNINGNTISDDGAAAISEGLKCNNSLQELYMKYNKITCEGAKKIGEAIEVNTTLHKLNINRNTISDDGAAAISEGLKCNNSLQELYMEYNKITCEGAKKIGEAIEVNTTLHKLNINGNIISDDGAAAISEGLKCNISLQELYIKCNEITCEGAKKIGEAIKVNTTLHTLHFYEYIINDQLSFNMTVLTAVNHNNTLMKLRLPCVNGDDQRLVDSEVEKINKERTRQGISTLTCDY